jgi:hypothetical protein
VGGAEGGLNGLAVALLIVRLAEAIVTAPPVIRAAFGHGRHRRTEFTGVATASTGRNEELDRSAPRRALTTKRDEQEAGLAALLMLAARTDATGPLPAILPGVSDPALITASHLAERGGKRTVATQASDSVLDRHSEV